jgi:hypothetical protein
MVSEGRRDVLEALAERGIEPVILDEQTAKLGGVETWQDAKKSATLFDERIRTPCGHERLAYGKDFKRGVHDLFRLGYVHAQLARKKNTRRKKRRAYCG